MMRDKKWEALVQQDNQQLCSHASGTHVMTASLIHDNPPLQSQATCVAPAAWYAAFTAALIW